MNGRDYKHLSEGDIPVYGSGGIMTYVNESAYNKPSLLIPRKGSIGNLFYVETPFWTVDTLYWTKIDECLIVPKFFYYYMTTKDLTKLNMAAGVPSLTQSMLYKIKIPIPSLEEQHRIVSILDRFESLTTSSRLVSLPKSRHAASSTSTTETSCLPSSARAQPNLTFNT